MPTIFTTVVRMLIDYESDHLQIVRLDECAFAL